MENAAGTSSCNPTKSTAVISSSTCTKSLSEPHLAKILTAPQGMSAKHLDSKRTVALDDCLDEQPQLTDVNELNSLSPASTDLSSDGTQPEDQEELAGALSNTSKLPLEVSDALEDVRNRSTPESSFNSNPYSDMHTYSPSLTVTQAPTSLPVQPNMFPSSVPSTPTGLLNPPNAYPNVAHHIPPLLLHPRVPYVQPNLGTPTTVSPSLLQPLPPHLSNLGAQPRLNSSAAVADVLTQPSEGAAQMSATMTNSLITTVGSSLTGTATGPSDTHVSGPNSSGEYYVMVHVDAGETFSVRVGDQIQHIPGPATVRMVSNSGPPLPMPMQVPPGHLVQQIVDEEGILTHVILSLYPGPTPPPPPPAQSAQAAGGGANTASPNSAGGLIGPAAGLVLDPSQHLNRHTVTPSSASVVAGHLAVGTSIPLSPFTPHGHQVLPSPATHYHSQFVHQLPHPHFHPYHMHPQHQPVCGTAPSAGKPIFQPNGSIARYHVTDENGGDSLFSAELTVPMINGELSTKGQYEVLSKKNPPPDGDLPFAALDGFSANDIEMSTVAKCANDVQTICPTDEQTDSFDQTSNEPPQTPPTNSVTDPLKADEFEDKQDPNSDKGLNGHASPAGRSESAALGPGSRLSKRPPRLQHWNTSKFIKEQRGSVSNARMSSDCASQLENGGGEKSHKSKEFLPLCGSEKGGKPTMNSNSNEKATNFRVNNTVNEEARCSFKSSPSKSASSTTVAGEMTTNGTTLGQPDFTTLDQDGNSVSQTEMDTPYPASGIPPHRRRRSGAMKSFRPHSRPSGFGPNKTPSAPMQTTGGGAGAVSATNGHTNTKTSSAPTQPGTVTSGPYRPGGDRWAADTNNNNTNSGTSGFMASNFKQIPSKYPISASTTGVPYSAFRGRRNANQACLLNTPISTTPAGNDLVEAVNPLDHADFPCSVLETDSNRQSATTPEVQKRWESDYEREVIQNLLSAIPAPLVSDIDSRSALIHLSLPVDLTVPSPSNDLQPKGAPSQSSPAHPPASKLQLNTSRPVSSSDMPVVNRKLQTSGRDGSSVQQPISPSSQGKKKSSDWVLDDNDIQFELHLAERDSDSRFNCVFIGEATYISLQDLRPGTNYYVKSCCVYSDIRGRFSDLVHFTTVPTEPSAPKSLTVIGHTRTSLHLKWSAASDNGSRITAYRLEYAPVSSLNRQWCTTDSGIPENGVVSPEFVEGFHGLTKSCKLTQLTPSTEYLLRVMAENALGLSPWSSVISASTSGSPPPTPRTPFLVAADVHSLTLAWHQSSDSTKPPGNSTPVSAEVNYTLEMDDEAMGHGFVTVFDGTGTEHCVENLRRNTRYRFRLAASNVDGRSRWSEVVTVSTLPDQPSPPRDLRLSSPLKPTQMVVGWDPPEDDGGLPVHAYRLEMCLPYLSAVSKNSTTKLPNQRGTNEPSLEICAEQLICWPVVIGLGGKTAFACSPPSGEIGSRGTLPRIISSAYPEPRTSYCDIDYQASGAHPSRVNDWTSTTCTDVRVPESGASSPEKRSNPHVLDPETNRYRPWSSPSSFASYLTAWFVIYEGSGQEVGISNLLPGLQLAVRVRARSSIPSELSSSSYTATIPGSPLASSEPGDSSNVGFWGAPSSPSLRVSLPPVQPGAPSSPPRLVGRPRPTTLRLSWQPPANTGGAPILAYEVWKKTMEQADPEMDGSDSDSMTSVSAPPSFSPPPSPPSPRSRSSSVGIDVMKIDENSRDPHLLPSLYSAKNDRCSSVDSNLSKTEPFFFYRSDNEQTPNGAMGHFVCSVSSLECRVGGLRPGRTYAFRVRACNLVGRGPWSPWSTVSTVPSPPTAPKYPPRIQPQPNSKILISWDSVRHSNGSKISRYILEWQPLPPLFAYHTPIESVQIQSESGKTPVTSRDSKEDLCFQLLYSGPSLSYELEGVQPASRLAFRFCAVNAAGPGPWSPVGSCLTPSAAPGQPPGLQIVQTGINTALVRWLMPQPNGSPVTSFTLELTQLTPTVELKSEDDTSNVILIDIPSPKPWWPDPWSFGSDNSNPAARNNGKEQEKAKTTAPVLCHSCGGSKQSRHVEHLVDKLLPSSVYKVRVRALNSLGYGIFSAGLLFTTLPVPPPAPEFKPCTHITATSVKLQWTMPPKHDRSGQSESGAGRGSDEPILAGSGSNQHEQQQFCYTLQMSLASDLSWSTVYEGEDKGYKVTRLNENSAYAFRVRATNVSGPGPFSQLQSVSTLRLPPPVVRGLKVAELGPDWCQLEWSAVGFTTNNNLAGGVTNVCSTDPLVYVLQLTAVPQQQASDSFHSTQTQVYRGTQTTCRVLDLLPSTEYVGRVYAVRLCMPSEFPISTDYDIQESGDDDKRNISNLSNGWYREVIKNPALKVTELPGPYSHSVVFVTRSGKEQRTPTHSYAESLSCVSINQRLQTTPKHQKADKRHWSVRVLKLPYNLIYSGFNHLFRFLRTSSLSQLPSERSSPSAPVPISAVARSSSLNCSSLCAGASASPSSPWRRRPTVGASGASSLVNIQQGQQQQSKQQQQQPCSPQPHHSHHSASKRTQSWFRLSDRKLACLLLFLFVAATLLVAVSLQHFITTPIAGEKQQESPNSLQ
ncbi:unnamed protein product [Calicophoron daubneyi]|uniref:Fibronectin type-III domain-containing protein n=1 Tax=Calicophoron daubneyi TaxID=300641 RepID=A0AAV2TLM9_CALDB